MLWGLLSFKQHLLLGRSKTPRKKKSGWKCFVGVWRWTCQSKPPGRRNQAKSASSGFGGGHARANPLEEEMRLEVLRRGLEVDMPEQPPGKKKSRWKCFVGFWRWTCQNKPPGRRNKAGSANPQEEEIRLKVLCRGLEVDMPEQTPGKKKSGWKCFVARWTCHSKPPVVLILWLTSKLWHHGRLAPNIKWNKWMAWNMIVLFVSWKGSFLLLFFRSLIDAFFWMVLMPPSISGMLWLV